MVLAEWVRITPVAEWAGQRFLYLAANGAVWAAAGEWAFLVTCVLMIKFFRRIDHAPTMLYSHGAHPCSVI